MSFHGLVSRAALAFFGFSAVGLSSAAAAGLASSAARRAADGTPTANAAAANNVNAVRDRRINNPFRRSEFGRGIAPQREVFNCLMPRRASLDKAVVSRPAPA